MHLSCIHTTKVRPAMRSRYLLLAALCATLPFSAQAQTFRAESKLIVVPLNATDFEVVETRTSGPRGYWCAAADFARSRLGAAQGTRLYIKSARGPSISAQGKRGVVYTTDASRLAADPNKGYFVSLTKVGYNLSVGHAYSFCYGYWEIIPPR